MDLRTFRRSGNPITGNRSSNCFRELTKSGSLGTQLNCTFALTSPQTVSKQRRPAINGKLPLLSIRFRIVQGQNRELTVM